MVTGKLAEQISALILERYVTNTLMIEGEEEPSIIEILKKSKSVNSFEILPAYKKKHEWYAQRPAFHVTVSEIEINHQRNRSK